MTTSLPRIETAEFAPGEATAMAGRYGAHNYKPIDVELATAEGCWVTDTSGNRYLDLLAGYSALNFGHRHPRLVEAAHHQIDRMTLSSRAFSSDQIGPFFRDLAHLCGKEMVLPMNTGAEAVETGIKIARRWGYARRGVPADRARIIVCDGNFHGRTTTIVGFSTDPVSHDGFGPYAPGFLHVPFGDAEALESVIDEYTVGFLFEPVQGEGGVVVPPPGYLSQVRSICSTYDILMIADEIQSGLGRTGRMFACDHELVVPDLYLLGKALGGGIVPVSAVVGDADVVGVIGPGQHGSTFGGNPLACAVGRAVLELLTHGDFVERAAELGPRLVEGLRAVCGKHALDVRGIGLWAGVDLDPSGPSGYEMCTRLAAHGVLAKDTHGHTLRFGPPLVITEAEIDWGLERIERVIGESY